MSLDSRQLNDFPDIITPVYDSKRRKIKNYPQHKNRASEVGHPCLKYLVLCRTRWEDKLLHGPELEFIFEGGRMIEDMALRELQDAGFTIIEQQRAFEIKPIQLTGHIDAKILVDGSPYPLEVKGLNHYDFIKLNTIKDFYNSTKVWIRKYPAQLMMYLMASEIERGVFYIKDKLNYQPKAVWVDLDYDYAEQIYQKMERANKHIENGTLPECTDDYDVCQYCSFLHICLPEHRQQAMEFIDDPELEEKLVRWEELKQHYSEYMALDKNIKKTIEGKDKLMVGDFMISGKWLQRKGYVVEDSQYWRSKITKLSPQVEEATELGQDF